MRKLNTKEIQAVEENILKDFVGFCEKNHLYYTLCGGTLLGAIRHKGFIPWDDDIDVLMPRPDYDRILNDVNLDYSELPEYIQIWHWKNNRSAFPFIKFVDIRTKIDSRYYSKDIEHLWIDIFPIDGNPEDEKSLKKIYRKSIFLRKCLLIKKAKLGEGKTLIKKVCKPFAKIFLGIIPVSYLCRRIDALSKTYDFRNAKYIGGILWGYGTQERIRKEAYLIPIKVEFGVERFNAPSNYENYLKGLYGDYMQLPPAEQRVTHDMIAYMDEGSEYV